MSFQHHVPERDSEIIKRMLSEMDSGVTNKFPNGKLDPDDEGAAHFGIVVDLESRVVRIQFSKPILWIGLDLDSAKKLRSLLDEKISQLEN